MRYEQECRPRSGFASMRRPAALKTASECSFTNRKVGRDPGRSSAVFALPYLRLKTFRTVPGTPAD
jgi:hypothetical protein